MLECLLCIALSPHFNTYESTIRTEPGIHVSVADPLYLWGSYESPQLRILGQYMPTTVAGAGLGYRHEMDRVSLFVEAGYFWPETDPLEVVKDEIVNQVLVNDHGAGRKLFRADTHIYELYSGWGGRVGLDIQMTKRLYAFAAYRFLNFNELVAMCQGPDRCSYPETTEAGYRHWVNADTRNYSSVQVGFTIRL